jgi:DNA polymerase/3'-5' exonuclease PolX
MTVEHSQAFSIAERLVDQFNPGCKRIEIAGSLRRLKPEVGDIEIVAVPDLRPPPAIFGHKPFTTSLDVILYNLSFENAGDSDGLLLHQFMGGPKFKKLCVSLDGGKSWCIKLDMFLVIPPADWGVIYLIRTGPAEFSHWLVTPRRQGGALPNGYYVERGAIWQMMTKVYLPMAEEINFLNFCELDWIEPRDRRPRWNIFAGIADHVSSSQQPAKRRCQVYKI